MGGWEWSGRECSRRAWYGNNTTCASLTADRAA